MSIADQILYEDNHLIAVNKQPGQIVQADITGDTCMADLLKAYIKERDGKPGNVFCGVIHRLDRPVSGVVLFAKTSKALSRMNQMVKERDFQKIYRAVVTHMPPASQGHLEDYLVRNAKLNKSFITADSANPEAKLASLDCLPPPKAGIICSRSNCIPAAITKSAANWPTWGVPSRET